MCGIVGYVGTEDCVEEILNGLHRLEYRGYDSAGMALWNPNSEQLDVIKTAGKIDALESRLKTDLPTCQSLRTAGIGHTRWATHGTPTVANAHPHTSSSGDFAVVHNGIIENYQMLKKRLIEDGFSFKSETDSEVLAHLIQQCYEGDVTRAVSAALKNIEGTYGIAVISRLHPDIIVTARKGSPIAVGICRDKTIIASDVSAIVQHTDRVIFLKDNDILTASANNIEIVSRDNIPISREMTHIDWDVEQLEKDGYEHFMLKEIHGQPGAIADATRGRLLREEGSSKLDGLQMPAREMASVNRVLIVACGTSLYAAMIGKHFLENFADIPTEVQQAAEFRYRNPIIKDKTCVIAISQSGETADTLAAVREAMRKGATVLGICNVVGSTIARETGRGVYMHAGPEIGVASTKAFSCQLTVLAMMALRFGRTHRLPLGEGKEIVQSIQRLPEYTKAVLDREDAIRKIAEKYSEFKNAFFIGRGYMYPAALEGALKLKEISYIHAEGYHAAELKHGPIALLDSNVPVVGLVPKIHGYHKTVGNLQEAKARGAPILAIATEDDLNIKEHCDDTIFIPECPEYLTPACAVIAEQLLAYYVAKKLGREIDQPRNLAKSVTVE